jgi:imidazole glycerol-phosphate synthase subunit HisH
VIALIDYRAGNLASVGKAFAHLGHQAAITSDPDVVARAERLVLPGVGHFGATTALDPLRQPIADAIARGVPFLGICVGMQWMFAGSDEAPTVAGLGLLPGRCARFGNALGSQSRALPGDAGKAGNREPKMEIRPGILFKVPHVGWNTVERRGTSRLLRDLPDGFFAYYTHSFYAPVGEATVGTTQYGAPFSAVVERGHLFGVQFHPEKSAEAGLRLLDNFARLAC